MKCIPGKKIFSVSSLLLLLLSLPPLAIAQEVVLRDTVLIIGFDETGRVEQPLVDISEHMSYLRDPGGELTLNEIKQLDEQFLPLSGRSATFGNTTDAIWFKLTIKNNSPDIFVGIDNETLHHISFFSKNRSEEYEELITGFLHDFNSRPVDDNIFLFPLNISGEQEEYYFRIKSDHMFSSPFKLGHISSFESYSFKKDILYALYLGIALSLFLYNLFIYIITKRKTYVFYLLYIVCIFVMVTSEHGFFFQNLHPDYPELNRLFPFLPFVTAIFILLFVQNFLETKKYTPVLDKITNVIIGLLVLLCVFYLVTWDYRVAVTIGQITGLVFITDSLLIIYFAARNGNTNSRLYTAGIVAFFLSIVLYLMSQNNVLPDVFVLRHAVVFGSSVEIIMFSLALANWINRIRVEANETLEATNTELQKSELRLKETITRQEEFQKQMKRQNKKLILSEEQMRKIAEEQLETSEKLLVTQAELQSILTSERESYKQLLEAQSQLVNNEKMASLGQLTAGIAHEINNPINFIYNGIDTLKLTLEELLMVIDKTDIPETEADRKRIAQEIVALNNRYNINELSNDVEELVADIQKGAVRTMEIVKGLRVFSRLDEEEQKPANVNENLDATLVLLRNKTKDKIAVRKFYDSSIEDITCYPGQLNQVFMNILSNAIQAIPEGRKDGEIMVYTENRAEEVIIRIKDNGSGIAEDVQKRIFEPFFTTKAVGVGTGLGLSIVYGIVEKHGGKIYVNSKVGEGTEFVIHLPKAV